MVKTKLIETVVETAFEKVYGYQEENKLIKIMENERINHLSYALLENLSGIICEFSVSDTGVYEASSKGDLLCSKWRLEDWLEFIDLIKNSLSEVIGGNE